MSGITFGALRSSKTNEQWSNFWSSLLTSFTRPGQPSNSWRTSRCYESFSIDSLLHYRYDLLTAPNPGGPWTTPPATHRLCHLGQSIWYVEKGHIIDNRERLYFSVLPGRCMTILKHILFESAHSAPFEPKSGVTWSSLLFSIMCSNEETNMSSLTEFPAHTHSFQIVKACKISRQNEKSAHTGA